MGAAKKKVNTVRHLKTVSKKDQNDHLVDALNRSQAVIEFDLTGKIIHANDNFLKAMGYEQNELIGRHHSMFCDPEYARSQEYKDFWNTLAKGEFVRGEFQRFGKNNREVWVIASYNPVFDDNGQIEKYIKFATDVTSSKAELRARIDIMNMTSIVSEANLRGDILTVNDKFIEVSKYSKEELIGKPHNITRHPDMSKEVFKEMWSTIGRGNLFRGIIKNRAKDGTPYYVDAVIAPILGDNGKPKKYLGVRYDITTNEIERQNMKSVIAAIDSSYAYIEFDTIGNILTFNKNFQEATGYSVEEVRGRHHRIFCEAEYANSLEYTKFWPDLKTGQSKSGIFKRVTRSGEIVWMQAVYSPVKDEVGRVYKVVKIATDVTDQQNMIVSIQETANTLAVASQELTATAGEMSGTAEKTSRDAQTASVSAEQVAAGVQTVATNMEETVASIKEISRTTSESAHMAKLTMSKAQESNEIVTKLGISSQEIGDVIKVISSIAQQTNLLALNATIEAARAGEAGKGFAVVANEVKELAKQTAQATNEITTKISAIQSDTQSAVSAIADISDSVEKLNSLSGVIATAVEEQTATTNEISRVLVESKKGVDSIAETVKNVSMAAEVSNTSSGQTLVASRELRELAERLSALVRRN